MTKSTKIIFRDSTDGKFTTERKVKDNPDTTTTEKHTVVTMPTEAEIEAASLEYATGRSWEKESLAFAAGVTWLIAELN